MSLEHLDAETSFLEQLWIMGNRLSPLVGGAGGACRPEVLARKISSSILHSSKALPMISRPIGDKLINQ